jgi:hypothetical protein
MRTERIAEQIVWWRKFGQVNAPGRGTINALERICTPFAAPIVLPKSDTATPQVEQPSPGLTGRQRVSGACLALGGGQPLAWYVGGLYAEL